MFFIRLPLGFRKNAGSEPWISQRERCMGLNDEGVRAPAARGRGCSRVRGGPPRLQNNSGTGGKLEECSSPHMIRRKGDASAGRTVRIGNSTNCFLTYTGTPSQMYSPHRSESQLRHPDCYPFRRIASAGNTTAIAPALIACHVNIERL